MTQTTIDGSPTTKARGRARQTKGRDFFAASGESFEDIVNDMEKVHGRKRFYALASGGKDSMYVVDRLARMGKLETVVHIRTNVGLEMTTDFLVDYCKEMGWPLRIIEPKARYIYVSHVLQYGFPSTGIHNVIMAKLKYIPMRDFILNEDREGHVLVSGVRRYESRRRMQNFPDPILRDGSMWFCAPAFHMTDSDIYRYVHTEGLKISPAYKRGFNTSGECMCGSFAARGEKKLIHDVDENLAGSFEWLEEGVRRFGTPMARKYGQWGGTAKMTEIEMQKILDVFVKTHADVPLEAAEQVVCGAECGAGTMRGETDF